MLCYDIIKNKKLKLSCNRAQILHIVYSVCMGLHLHSWCLANDTAKLLQVSSFACGAHVRWDCHMENMGKSYMAIFSL